MDPLLLGLFVRFFERITIVLIGGMACYLGFRLFRELPEHRDSSGNVTLPWDISIKLTRVGPGLFFAVFGVAAVSLALFRPLEIHPQLSVQREDRGAESGLIYAHPTPGNREARADARSLLQKNFSALNYIPTSLRPDLPAEDLASFESNIREIKLKLMRPTWGDPEEGFGDFGVFENWVKIGAPDPPPPGMAGAIALYRHK